jgi:hypothetical protein
LAGSDEPHTVAAEGRKLLIEVQDAPPETINFPDEYAIEGMLCGILHEPI